MRTVRFLISLAAFVAVWAVIAAILQSDKLPTPWAVAAFIYQDLVHGPMLFHLGMTLWRATAGFVIAMVIGCGLGFVFGRSEKLNDAFMPWVLVLMNTPLLVIAFLCYIWFRTNETSAILAVVLSKFPNNTVILRDGVRSFDPGLDDIAKIYRFSRLKQFQHILLPQAMPFLMAAARSGIGIVWKIVIVVEIFGLSSGVGFQLYTYFQVQETKQIFGYAAAFSLIMLAVEFLILQPLDNHVRRWRTAS